MIESLGTAVLTLKTDATQFDAGLDQTRQKAAGLEKEFRGLSGVMSSLSKLGPALAASLSIGAITGAVKSYADFTGQLTDMAAKTGIGTAALQRLKYAAEQNGSSLEAVTGLVTKLGINLAGGNTSAVGALNALGLSFEEIRAMSPEKAFATIGDAIAKIPDPMAQSKLGADLMGKGFAEVLPMMKGNLSETMKAADALGIVMSDDAVQAGDKFGDSMGSLMAVGQAVIGQMLTPMIPAMTSVALWLGENIPKALTAARGAFDWLIKKGMETELSFREFILSIVELGAKVPWLGEKLGATSTRIAEMRQGVQWSKDAIAAFDRQTQTTTTTVTTAAGSLATLNLNYGKTEKAADAAAKKQERFEKSVRQLVSVVGRGPGGLAQNFTDLDANILPSYSALLFSATEHTDAFGRVTSTQLSPSLKGATTDLTGVSASVKTFGASHSVFQETWANISATMSTSLSDMLTGQMGFKDGVANIWRSIKDGVGNILNEMLGDFVNGFLKNSLNSILGSQGAFQGAFSQAMGSPFQGVLGGLSKTLSGWLSAASKSISGLLGFGSSIASGAAGAGAGAAAAGAGAASAGAGAAAGGGGAAMVGLLTNPITAIVAGGIGAFVGIKKWMGQKEHMAVNDLRDAWFNANGGLEGVNQAAQGAGDSNLNTTKAIFGAKTKDDFANAVAAWTQVTKTGIAMPGLAKGGLVTGPMISALGEAGPELVIPLDRLKGGSGIPLHVHVNLNGREIARAIVPELPRAVKAFV